MLREDHGVDEDVPGGAEDYTRGRATRNCYDSIILARKCMQ